MAPAQQEEDIVLSFAGCPVAFSQHHEDIHVIRGALRVQPGDDVLIIGACGDNFLSVLLDDPSTLSVVDYSFAQNCMCELKMEAIRQFDVDEYINFIGVRNGTDRNTCRLWRLDMFQKLSKSLPDNVVKFWENHLDAIKMGIINCGGWEHKILENFREEWLHGVLPLATLKKMLQTESLKEQKVILEGLDCEAIKEAVGKWWASLDLQIHRMSQLDKEDSQVKMGQKFVKLLQNTHIRENWFMEYTTTGEYNVGLFQYLQPGNYEFVKSRLNRVKIYECEISAFFEKEKDQKFDRISLSNIADHQTQDEHVTMMQRASAARKPKKPFVLVELALAGWTKPAPSLDGVLRNEKLEYKLHHEVDKALTWDAPYVFECNMA